MILISQVELRRCLDYNPDTGIFIWKIKKRGRWVRVGRVAGTITERGYVNIVINGSHFWAHRLAWFYIHGAWPIGDIDHINHNPSDNRISNLRDGSTSQNLENQIRPRSDNKSGYLGVSLHSDGKKWVAQINLNKKGRYLGSYETPELASAAYLREKKKIHSFNTL